MSDIIKLDSIDSIMPNRKSALVKASSIRGLELDIYLLPYTREEFLDPRRIPDRTLEQAQKVKIHHIKESYIAAIQLLFSALVMTHENIPHFSSRIPSKVSKTAKAGNLVPEYRAALDNIFANEHTQVRKQTYNCSYKDLSSVFDIGKSFFRGEPGTGQGQIGETFYAGWYFDFYGTGNNSISVKFDPWFKTMNCNIINALWSHFRQRFPQHKSLHHQLEDDALESRMATYLGFNISGNADFIHTLRNLLSQNFDLYKLEQEISYHGILGTRKNSYPQDPSPTILTLAQH